MLHDLNPRTELRQVLPVPENLERIWNGDPWKTAVYLRAEPSLDLRIVDIDHGVG